MICRSLQRLTNTCQLSAGRKFSLSRYRLHISASTGVCTLPSELFPKPTAQEFQAYPYDRIISTLGQLISVPEDKSGCPL